MNGMPSQLVPDKKKMNKEQLYIPSGALYCFVEKKATNIRQGTR
jgi:hypothetical protein